MAKNVYRLDNGWSQKTNYKYIYTVAFDNWHSTASNSQSR